MALSKALLTVPLGFKIDTSELANEVGVLDIEPDSSNLDSYLVIAENNFHLLKATDTFLIM